MVCLAILATAFSNSVSLKAEEAQLLVHLPTII